MRLFYYRLDCHIIKRISQCKIDFERYHGKKKIDFERCHNKRLILDTNNKKIDSENHHNKLLIFLSYGCFLECCLEANLHFEQTQTIYVVAKYSQNCSTPFICAAFIGNFYDDSPCLV